MVLNDDDELAWTEWRQALIVLPRLWAQGFDGGHERRRCVDVVL